MTRIPVANAIVVATQTSVSTVAPTFFNAVLGLGYNADTGKWAIYTQTREDIPAGINFNVIIMAAAE